MDRVGVCHPEMASEMLLCQFGRFMHTMPKCTPRAVLKHLLGSHDPYGDYCGESPCTFGARWAIPSYRARLEPHGLFQDACVNHNRVDADNDPATRMHTPLSKSSAEGNNIQNHDCRNCVPSSTIVGYVAFYSQSALRSFPTPIAMN